LPTTGFVGGWGMGLSLFFDAITRSILLVRSESDEAIQSPRQLWIVSLRSP
jgi:hypothetical protein